MNNNIKNNRYEDNKGIINNNNKNKFDNNTNKNRYDNDNNKNINNDNMNNKNRYESDNIW